MSNKPVVIKFFAPTIDVTISALINTVDDKLREGRTNFVILLSSPGGSVFYSLSAYNYLRGIPATITTHNFGSVDSTGVILYCSGSRRLSVPRARFIIHGVRSTFGSGESLDEKQLVERLNGLRIDTDNVARVLSVTTGKSVEEIRAAMLERTTLNPVAAKSWGLVQEIKTELFESGSEVISIPYNP